MLVVSATVLVTISSPAFNSCKLSGKKPVVLEAPHTEEAMLR